MNEENKTQGQSTALALNNQETLDTLKKEVQEEFVTSDREVYKVGLRSLLVQEQKLQRQIEEIKGEIKHLHDAREALDEAFKNGSLHSVADARGVVRQVRQSLANTIVDAEFDN